MKRQLNRTSLGWAVHNLIAHPASEVLWICAFVLEALCLPNLADRAEDLGHWIHDVTVPDHDPGTGRG